MVAHICGKCRERFGSAVEVQEHQPECTAESRAERSFGEGYRALSPASRAQIDCIVDVAVRFGIVPMDLLLALRPYREAVLEEIREISLARAADRHSHSGTSMGVAAVGPDGQHHHTAPVIPHYPPIVYPPVGTVMARGEGQEILPPGWVPTADPRFMEYAGQPEIRQSDAD